MEDSQLLKRKQWSVVRKAQMIAGMLGALITLIMTWPFSRSGSGPTRDGVASDFLFDAFLFLIRPTVKLCEALGISQGHLWLWPLGILVNTFLCIIIGTFIGWIMSLMSKTQVPKNEHSL